MKVFRRLSKMLRLDWCNPEAAVAAAFFRTSCAHWFDEPFQVVLGELSMTGSVAGMGEDVYDAITLVSHGRFQLEPFTSLRIPLANIAEGFKKAEDKSALKVLIDMT